MMMIRIQYINYHRADLPYKFDAIWAFGDCAECYRVQMGILYRANGDT